MAAGEKRVGVFGILDETNRDSANWQPPTAN
jgi:hypothetical protein